MIQATTDIFDDVRIRSLWIGKDGMYRAWEPTPQKERPTRKYPWYASVSLAIAFAAASIDVPSALTQAAMIWPSPPTEAHVKDALRSSLQALRKIGRDWTGHSGAAPASESLAAAERLLPQLPNLGSLAKAGVDADGHVYLRLSRGTRVAYLTVEPRVLHLFYTNAGQDNVYIDDQKFHGSVLPPRISRVLAEKLA